MKNLARMKMASSVASASTNNGGINLYVISSKISHDLEGCCTTRPY